MRIRFLLESLASARKKYPDIVENAKHYDPTPTFKYVEWLCSRWDKEQVIDDCIPILTKFDKIHNQLKKKTINEYETYVELKDAVENYVSKKEKENLLRKIPDGAEKIFENDKAAVIRVDTYEASCFYGKGKFCIAHSTTSNHWDGYTSRGNIFFYIIDKNDIKRPQVIQVEKGKSPIKGLEKYFKKEKNSEIGGWSKNNSRTDPKEILDPLDIPIKTFKLNGNSEPNADFISDLLTKCSYSGDLEAVKILLKLPNIDVTYGNNQSITNASMHGHTEIVKLLLPMKGINPAICGNNPIRFAVDYNHSETVKVLLEDPRVDATANGHEALNAALHEKFKNILILLLKWYKKTDRSMPSVYEERLSERYPELYNEYKNIIKS